MTRYESVRETIKPGVKLIAVSKTRSAGEISEIYKQGQRDFGENRVQELLAKQNELARSCPEIIWHLIGTLQKNKVRHIVGKADLIHSVDSLSLLKEISKRAVIRGITQDVLLQVNFSGEETKHGLPPNELWSVLEEAAGLEGVRVRGLMTMSAMGMDSAEKLAYFKDFKAFYDDLRNRSGSDCFDILSMGMSGDYREAMEAGSTLVRLGTAIFGPREYDLR